MVIHLIHDRLVFPGNVVSYTRDEDVSEDEGAERTNGETVEGDCKSVDRDDEKTSDHLRGSDAEDGCGSNTDSDDKEQKLRDVIFVITRNKVPVRYMKRMKDLHGVLENVKETVISAYDIKYHERYVWEDDYSRTDDGRMIKSTLMQLSVNSIRSIYVVEDVIEIYEVEEFP